MTKMSSMPHLIDFFPSPTVSYLFIFAFYTKQTNTLQCLPNGLDSPGKISIHKVRPIATQFSYIFTFTLVVSIRIFFPLYISVSFFCFSWKVDSPCLQLLRVEKVHSIVHCSLFFSKINK